MHTPGRLGEQGILTSRSNAEGKISQTCLNVNENDYHFNKSLSDGNGECIGGVEMEDYGIGGGVGLQDRFVDRARKRDCKFPAWIPGERLRNCRRAGPNAISHREAWRRRPGIMVTSTGVGSRSNPPGLGVPGRSSEFHRARAAPRGAGRPGRRASGNPQSPPRSGRLPWRRAG